jgi:hypothetical protein
MDQGSNGLFVLAFNGRNLPGVTKYLLEDLETAKAY